MHSFQDEPPVIAYLDPSFLLNVLIADSTYHGECAAFATRLESARTILVLSNLGLDEIWFVLLRIQAVQEQGERGWLTFLKNNPEKVRVHISVGRDHAANSRDPRASPGRVERQPVVAGIESDGMVWAATPGRAARGGCL